MSWWSSSEIEREILKATSSSIPSGEQDLALNLEISDSVRSKQASASEVLKVLRKRLYDRNPNVQILTLHLLDLLIKNGGQHFFVECISKEFIDAYVAQLMSLVNQNRNPEVVDLMLDYFQTWAIAATSKPEASYLRDKYEELKKRRDINFPDAAAVSEISSSFLEAATAPEWIDSDTCMKSGVPFSFYNRKHHCRNCGGVFVQEYCANFRPLPHFGINIPTRVCDDCNAKLDAKYSGARPSNPDSDGTSKLPATSTDNTFQKKRITTNNRDIGSRYRADLEQAISLSLQASSASARPWSAAAGGSTTEKRGSDDEEEMDEDMKRAIEESLWEMKSQAANPQLNSASPQTAGEPLPQSKPKPSEPDIPAKVREAIEEFFAMVQLANPREAIYNERLIGLNQKALEMHPVIVSNLRLSSEKLAALEDLQGKLLAVSNCYDDLLELELNPKAAEQQRQQQIQQQHQQNQRQEEQQHENQQRQDQQPQPKQSEQVLAGASQPHETQQHTIWSPTGLQSPPPQTEHETVKKPEPEPEPEPILIEL